MSSVVGPPVITVVTVAYQDLDAVRRTCSSLRSQRCTDPWQHVLVDGGSSDGTSEWYEGNRPVHTSQLISEPDRGIFHAMNKGLAAATGEFVVFLNAGDVYADDRSLQRACDRVRSEQIDWGYARARVVDAAGQDVRPIVGTIPYSSLKHRFGRSTICHQAVVMRSDFLRFMGGFQEAYGTAGDYHLLLRAAQSSSPRCWNSVDVHYEAGGVSDEAVQKHLWRRHRARADVAEYGTVSNLLDACWTCLQSLNIRARKVVKPMLVRAGLIQYSLGSADANELGGRPADTARSADRPNGD